MAERYGAARDEALQLHIAPGSRSTYLTGWSHWVNFCTAYGVPEDVLTASPKQEIQGAFEYFCCYLRELPVAASTVSQYLTHVTSRLLELGVLPSSVLVRTPLVTNMIHDRRVAAH
jgi:hypothetical protein